MSKIILLPITAPLMDESVFTFALAAGWPFAAHFVALHVGRDPDREVAALAPNELGLGGEAQDFGAGTVADDSRRRLARMLRWPNENVSVQTLWDDDRLPLAVLLDAAAGAQCGLLVMGAMGTRLHGRRSSAASRAR